MYRNGAHVPYSPSAEPEKEPSLACLIIPRFLGRVVEVRLLKIVVSAGPSTRPRPQLRPRRPCGYKLGGRSRDGHSFCFNVD